MSLFASVLQVLLARKQEFRSKLKSQAVGVLLVLCYLEQNIADLLLVI